MAVDGRSPLVLVAALLAAGCATSSLSVVTVPVADVRAEPGSRPTSGVHDPLQETQLLYGERVRVHTRHGGWARIEAIEQPEYTHHQSWEGYPGWVQEDALQAPSAWRPNAVVGARSMIIWEDAFARVAMGQLPMGAFVIASHADGAMQHVQLIDGKTGWASPGDLHHVEQLERLPIDQRRRMIVRAAEAMLGDAYFWGGRSPAEPMGAMVTGVDCSGLVNLAYRTAGLTIPRDAHEQYLRARKPSALQPADLIFLSATDQPQNIVHVMLYAGDGWLIEGPGTGQVIRRISMSERLGLSPDPDGHASIGGQHIYLGTYFPDAHSHPNVVFGRPRHPR